MDQALPGRVAGVGWGTGCSQGKEAWRGDGGEALSYVTPN